MTAQRVLVAGCGYLGTALASRLALDGYLVWGMRRDVDALPAGLQAVEADLRVPNTLRRMPDVDVVVYLAAPGSDREEDQKAAHVDGLRYLLESMVARRQRLRRVVYASCLEVYGASDGRWVDEESRVEAERGRAHWLREGERLVAEGPFAATVVRLGELYGPGRLGLLDAVLGKRPLVAADATRWANLIHRDDAVGLLRHLLELRRPEGLYIGVDREPVAVPALVEWLAAQLGRQAPAVDGRVPTKAEAVNVRALSERLVDSGYRFIHPSYRDGYRAMLARVR